MSLLHSAILADPTKKVGDVINGFRVLKLDRSTGVCELEKVQTLLPTDGTAGQVVTLLADKSYGLSDPVKITVEAKNLYAGTGKPLDTDGTDGDFYEQLDAATDAYSIYGPKAGKWPATAQYKKITDYAKKADFLSDVNATGYPKLDKMWLSYATQSWVNDQLGDMQAAVNRIGAEWPDIAKKTDIPSFKAAFDNAADYLVPDSGDTALTGSQYVFTIPARATKLLSIEFEYHRPNDTHVDYWYLTTDFMRGIKSGAIPNDTDGWHYRTNGYYDEIIKYFYGGWAFYFDYIFHDDGSLELKIRTVVHNGEYKNIICRYASEPLHKLTLADLNDANSTTPGVIDPKTANAWLKEKNPSAADLTPVQAALKVLQDNEAADDTSFAALKAVVDAIPAAPDLSGFAKSVDVDKKADKAELPVIQRDNADHNPEKLSSIIGSVAYLENSNAGGFVINAVDYPVGYWSILTNPTDDDGYLFIDGFLSVYTVLGKTDMPSDTSVAYKVKANKTFLLQIIDKAGKSIKLTEITDDFAKFALKDDIKPPPPGLFLGTMLHANVPGSFPTTRQDGTAIQSGDFVRAVDANGAFVEDYINLGGPNWRTTGKYADLTPYLKSADAQTTYQVKGDYALRAANTALNINQNFTLYCQNSWIARSIGTIGDITKDFAAPDGSTHYLAKRDMVLDVSVTALTAEGGGMYVGLAVQLYRGGAWVDCLPSNGVTNPSAGVVPFHSSAQVAIKAGDYLRFLTNANNGGANNYPGNRDFRIAISETPSLLLMAAGQVVVTPRAISGSITGQAYEELDWPARIPLNSGEILASVTVNGTAVAYDAQSGFFVIPKGKGAVTVAHTTRAANGQKSIYSIVNSGTWVDFATIGIRIPASGNRSIQIRSVSGTIVINYVTALTWDGTRAPTAGLSVPTTGVYLEGSWSFGNTGNSMTAYIHDTTNWRRFKIMAMINSAYNNCHFVIEDIT